MSKWIDVKDRLPKIKEHVDYSDDVLICTRKNDMFVGYYTEYNWFGDTRKEWYSFGTGGRKMRVMSKVVAWMPLPEPYKKEVE